MIDIHTHITPNVDDGSSSIEMSLNMLRSEVTQGVNKVFLTPHCFAFETKRSEDVFAKMRRVQERAAAEGIPLQIYQGCEIYTYRDKMGRILQDLQGGRIPSMNGTRYVMAEFDIHEGNLEDARYCLNSYLEEGWIPIIAHAERYCWTFATVENIRILKDMGCLVQVNYYEPTLYDLADLIGETDEHVREAMIAMGGRVALDKPINDEEDDSESIGQLFSDDYYANDAELFEESRAIEIKEALKNMFCERDQEIMKHFYGLFGYEPKTLTQLSEMFGLSDERVRQIVRTCTRQLRKAEGLSDYQCA